MSRLPATRRTPSALLAGSRDLQVRLMPLTLQNITTHHPRTQRARELRAQTCVAIIRRCYKAFRGRSEGGRRRCCLRVKVRRLVHADSLASTAVRENPVGFQGNGGECGCGRMPVARE